MLTTFQKCKITLNPSIQVLPNNRLDKEVQRIAHSLNFPLYFFFSSNYHVRDYHIYPNGKTYHFLAFCFMLVMNALSLKRLLTVDFTDRRMDHIENIITTFIAFSFFISYIIGFTIKFILDVFHNQNNVFLILHIQAIQNHVDFSKNINNFIIWNWISQLTNVCFQVIIFTLYYYFNAGSNFVKSIPDYICDIVFIKFDVNTMIAIRIIILLRKYLDVWIKDINEMMSDEQDNDEKCRKLLEIYRNIFKTFDLYKTVSQGMALFQTFEALVRTLCYQDLTFYALKRSALVGGETQTRSEAPDLNFMTFVYITRNLAFIFMHSLYCEKFYITVEETETACIELMKNRNCPRSQRHLCKNVILVNRTFSKMSACGLFYVDALLPILLIGVIVEYIIALLQFTFL